MLRFLDPAWKNIAWTAQPAVPASLCVAAFFAQATYNYHQSAHHLEGSRNPEWGSLAMKLW